MSARGSSGTARRAALAAFTLVFACSLALAACGSDNTAAPAQFGGTNLGEGGTLRWALADPVREVDPLTATAESEQLAARQINEPLVEHLGGPFGDVRRVPGLARKANSSRGASVWAFEIRSGVRFQDGTRLNAGAVLVNAERWRTTPEGQRALGQVSAVDAPRPNLVRFFLPSPDKRFPERLADPRLGLVSPRALSPRSGTAATVTRSASTGTGAFELRERDAGGALLARNTGWWGTDTGLGPALDRIELEYVALAPERQRRLEEGEVELASGLDGSEAKAVGENPLLATLPSGGGSSLGIERSVRGIDSGRLTPSLASAWLTTISGPQ